MPKIKNCFSDFDLIGQVYEPLYESELYEPCEGFMPNQCPLLSELYRRFLINGGDLASIQGDYLDSDLDYMADKFDAMDEIHRISVQSARVVGSEKPAVAVPPPEVKPGSQQ